MCEQYVLWLNSGRNGISWNPFPTEKDFLQEWSVTPSLPPCKMRWCYGGIKYYWRDSYLCVCCLCTESVLVRLPDKLRCFSSATRRERDRQECLGLRHKWFPSGPLSCLVVKAVRRTCVVLGMRSWIKGLVLFCIKFVFILYSVFPLMVFPIPQPLTLSLWLFQVNTIKSLIPMSVIAKGLARGSVFFLVWWSRRISNFTKNPQRYCISLSLYGRNCI